MPVFYSLLSDCRWRRHPLRAGVSFIQVLSNLYIHNSFYTNIIIIVLCFNTLYQKDHVRTHFIDSLNTITIGHDEFSSTGRADGTQQAFMYFRVLIFELYHLQTSHLEILSTEIILQIISHTVLTIHTYLVLIMHLYRVYKKKVLCIFFACTLDLYKIRNSFFSHSDNILLNHCIFIWVVWEKTEFVLRSKRNTHLTQKKELYLYTYVLCHSLFLSMSHPLCNLT